MDMSASRSCRFHASPKRSSSFKESAPEGAVFVTVCSGRVVLCRSRPPFTVHLHCDTTREAPSRTSTSAATARTSHSPAFRRPATCTGLQLFRFASPRPHDAATMPPRASMHARGARPVRRAAPAAVRITGMAIEGSASRGIQRPASSSTLDRSRRGGQSTRSDSRCLEWTWSA